MTCEYGCEGKCAELSHWRLRFAYLLATAPGPDNPAPTEPRSISEEALGVQIGRVERLRDHLRDHVAMPRRLDGAALDALLAAYEQAEARAEAERDTAQASEARLRAALERIVRLEKKWSAPEKRVTEDDWAAWGAVGSDAVTLARDALASTPNPEERCGECGSDYKHGSTAVIPATAHCPDPWHRAPAPDPTPEPEEGRG